MLNDCGLTLQQYSTRRLPVKQRLDLWNQMVSTAIGPVDIQSSYRQGFNGEFSSRTVGHCVFRSVWSTAATVHCAPNADAVDPRTHAVTIQYLARGSCVARSDDRILQLRCGDLVLLDTAKPYSVSFDGPVLAHSVRLPRAQLVRLRIDPDKIVAVPVRARQGAASMFAAFLTSVCTGANDPFEDHWAGPVTDVLLTLLELVYRPSRLPSHRPAARTFERARQVVDTRLRDFEFNTRELASALEVSDRYLQLVFSREGTTPSKYILQRRLELAASRLSRRGNSSRISEIAYSAGFNDLSHFCHSFRKQYGVSPRNYRRQQGA